jgi:hypothetical protein
MIADRQTPKHPHHGGHDEEIVPPRGVDIAQVGSAACSSPQAKPEF